MLARLKMDLEGVPSRVRKGVNQRLAEVHPGRAIEAIESARKSQKYRDLLSDLRSRGLAESIPTTTTTCLEPVPELTSEAGAANPAWAEELQETLVRTPLDLDSIGLTDLLPGNPSQQVRERIDAEFLSGYRHANRGPTPTPPDLAPICPQDLWQGAEHCTLESNKITNVIADERLNESCRVNGQTKHHLSRTFLEGHLHNSVVRRYR